MAEKDITEKVLASFNDVFADIVNVFLFNGKNKISEEELVDVPVHSMYRNVNDGLIHELEQDVLKHWVKFGVKVALLGLENQTGIDPNMPIRIMGYEGASYRSQLGEKKPYPVVNIVLYFGDKHWSAPKRLSEIMNIPKELVPFVNDCKVNVFEISWLDEKTINKFQSDFKHVARFFSKKRNDPAYIPDDDEEIKHTDAILKLFSTLTQDSRYEEVLLDSKKGEIKSMCDVAERLEKIGIEKGRAEERDNFMQLLVRLSKDGEVLDVQRASADPEYLDELFRKYNI